MEAEISAGMIAKGEGYKMDFQERLKRRMEFDGNLVYGARNFNLSTRRKEHLDYRKEHDSQWIDLKTGLICGKFSERRNCPLCGADDFEVVFIKCGFPHVKCKKCSTVYVNPILNKEEYKKIWSAEESWENVLETRDQIKMQALEANYSLDIAGLYLEQGKSVRICDVGCGPGTLLGEAKRRGYRVFGVEPNKKCHKFLKDKEIDYTEEYFPLKRPIEKKFDCVFLLNALEHMPDPLMVVREAKKMLDPGGIIYISVPQIDALVNRVMHEKAGVFAGHSHIQFFSINTLSSFMEKSGFEVMEYETIISEIGIIKNYLSFKDPYFGQTEDRLDFITPEMIYKNHLARNLNMVGRLK